MTSTKVIKLIDEKKKKKQTNQISDLVQMCRWGAASDRSIRLPVIRHFLLRLWSMTTEVNIEVFNLKFHKESGWLWCNMWQSESNGTDATLYKGHLDSQSTQRFPQRLWSFPGCTFPRHPAMNSGLDWNMHVSLHCLYMSMWHSPGAVK